MQNQALFYKQTVNTVILCSKVTEMKKNKPSVDGKSKNSTVSKRCFNVLVDYILEHQLQSGDSLPPAEFFVENFGFSRVIVREALCYLKGMGVIIAGKGSGIKISDVEPVENLARLVSIFFSVSKKIGGLAKLRATMEVGEFYNIVRNVTDDQLNELQNNLEEVDKLLRRDDFGCYEYCLLEAEFHRILARISGNVLLQRLSDTYFRVTIDEKCRLDIASDFEKQEFRGAYNSHCSIFEAIKMHQMEIGLLLLANHLSGFHDKFD